MDSWQVFGGKIPRVLRDSARKTRPLRGSRGGWAPVVLLLVLVRVLDFRAVGFRARTPFVCGTCRRTRPRPAQIRVRVRVRVRISPVLSKGCAHRQNVVDANPLITYILSAPLRPLR